MKWHSQNHLFSFYQTLLRAYAAQFCPELEQLCLLASLSGSNPPQSFSGCVTELAKLTLALQKDARVLLTKPDFKVFVHERLRRFPPRQAWEPEAQPLSVGEEPERWLILSLDDPLQLKMHQLAQKPDIDDFQEFCTTYSYSLRICFGQYQAKLERILIGRLYSSYRFVPESFKQQQEAIAQQLEAEFSQQGSLSLILREEISCLACYGASVFALQSKIEAFQRQAGNVFSVALGPEGEQTEKQ